jgi:hypothetical protein
VKIFQCDLQNQSKKTSSRGCLEVNDGMNNVLHLHCHHHCCISDFKNIFRQLVIGSIALVKLITMCQQAAMKDAMFI